MSSLLKPGAFLLPLLAVLAFQVVTDPAVEKARTWFEATYPTVEYMGAKATLNWQEARKVTSPSGSTNFEVPLHENLEAQIGNLDENPVVKNQQLANGRVSVVIETRDEAYIALFLRINATDKFVLEHGKEAVLDNSFTNMASSNVSIRIFYNSST